MPRVYSGSPSLKLYTLSIDQVSRDPKSWLFEIWDGLRKLWL